MEFLYPALVPTSSNDSLVVMYIKHSTDSGVYYIKIVRNYLWVNDVTDNYNLFWLEEWNDIESVICLRKILTSGLKKLREKWRVMCLVLKMTINFNMCPHVMCITRQKTRVYVLCIFVLLYGYYKSMLGIFGILSNKVILKGHWDDILNCNLHQVWK